MPEETDTIDAVLFDAAGTLIELAEPIGETYSKLARQHGFLLYPAEVEHEFRRVWSQMPALGTPLPDADRSEKNWWRWLVHQIINELAPAVAENHGDYFEELFSHYAKPEAWNLYPEVITVLEQLKARGFRLAVLSNFDSRLLPVLEGLDISGFFEKIYYSGEIGHAKPSSEIFAHALGDLKLAPENCIHAGDDPVADWQGAAEVGLQVFELDRSVTDLTEIFSMISESSK